MSAAWVRNNSDRLALDYGCAFDAAEGRRAVEFLARFCTHSKGTWAGRAFDLAEWQRDVVMRLYGWRWPDGARRFRSVYVEVPKKNGKSTLVAGLNLYHLIADEEPGAEVYVCACDRQQASIIYGECERMVRASGPLRSRIDAIPSRKTLACGATNSTLRALSADADSNDGLNPSCVTFDELHRQRDARFYNLMRLATGTRRQPLHIDITTAGANTSGVWFRQRAYSEQVASGVLAEPEHLRHLGAVWAADPGDDPGDPATWARCNPSLGVTLQAADVKADWAKAQTDPVAMTDFKRYRLNLLVPEGAAFVNPEVWAALPEARPLEELEAEPCWGGLDLANVQDLAALALVWGDSARGFDVHVWGWVPREAADVRESRDRVPYRSWVDAGHLEGCEGAVIDHRDVKARVVDLAGRFSIESLYADPYNASQLLGELDQEGIPVKRFPQGFSRVSEPTKLLASLIASGRLRVTSNPALAWCASNAVEERDLHGNIRLSKAKSREKIDLIAALVNALAAAGAVKESAMVSAYETDSLVFA